jgi:DNA-binding transcriptional LysR family regulator
MGEIHFPNTGSPDLRLLQCFEMLMAEHSVSGAALRLNMSQPAMSRALGRLRKLFDDPLLIPRHGEMIPSPRALELLGEIREVRERMQRLLRRPDAFDPHKTRTQFSIMAPEHLEYLLAPCLLRRLSSEGSAVDVEFRPTDRERTSAMLERGDIDFRLGWWPNPVKTMRYKVLYREQLVCLAARNHPQIRGKVTATQYVSLQHARVRTYGVGASMLAIDHAVSQLGHTLRAPIRVQNEFAMSHVVSQSDLIASLPERLARKLAEQYSLQVMPLPIEIPEIPIALYWHERTHNHPAYRWFRQLLADTAKSL